MAFLKNLLTGFRNQIRPTYTTRGFLIRVAADLFVANIGLLLGFVTMVIYYLVRLGSIEGAWLEKKFFGEYLGSLILYNSVVFLSFSLSGLYGRARSYRAIDKFRSIAWAVGLAFVSHITLMYFIRAPLARSVSLPAWVYTFAGMLLLRMGKFLFTLRYVVEPVSGPKSEQVENVLVIGGAGYIGSVLVRMLLEKGYRVRVLDKLLFGSAPVEELLGRDGFDLVEGDFRNVEAVVRAARGVQAMVHLGAIVGDPACAIDEDITLQINLAATRMIREVCRGYGICRFIFASTCSVYGVQEDMIDEKSELAPVSLYARSKIDAERAVLELADRDFRPTVLRLGTAFGLSPRMRFDLVVNLLTAKAVSEGEITIFNPEQWRPFVHVRDISRAMLLCLEAPLGAVGTEILNVGSNDNNLRLGDLGRAVTEAVPGTEVHEEVRDDDPRSYRVDFSKIERAIGFSASVGLASGIREMADALRSGRVGPYSESIYSNVRHLKIAWGVEVAEAPIE